MTAHLNMSDPKSALTSMSAPPARSSQFKKAPAPLVLPGTAGITPIPVTETLADTQKRTALLPGAARLDALHRTRPVCCSGMACPACRHSAHASKCKPCRTRVPTTSSVIPGSGANGGQQAGLEQEQQQRLQPHQLLQCLRVVQVVICVRLQHACSSSMLSLCSGKVQQSSPI